MLLPLREPNNPTELQVHTSSKQRRRDQHQRRVNHIRRQRIFRRLNRRYGSGDIARGLTVAPEHEWEPVPCPSPDELVGVQERGGEEAEGHDDGAWG